jgi:hypothetical protein
MRRLIGTSIQSACRFALLIGLGIRQPAAKIREHDLIAERERIAAQVRQSIEQASSLIAELHRLDNAIAAQHADMNRMDETRHRLRMPAPTQSIGDL